MLLAAYIETSRCDYDLFHLKIQDFITSQTWILGTGWTSVCCMHLYSPTVHLSVIRWDGAFLLQRRQVCSLFVSFKTKYFPCTHLTGQEESYSDCPADCSSSSIWSFFYLEPVKITEALHEKKGLVPWRSALSCFFT